MGQQQLLLLVLGIVIVGLAVVAGINAFSENQSKSARDAIVNEGIRLATDIKAKALKPEQLGGGLGTTSGGSTTYDNLATLFPNNNSASGNNYTTPYGTIAYAPTTGKAQLSFTATNATVNDKVCVFGEDGVSTDSGPSLVGSSATCKAAP